MKIKFTLLTIMLALFGLSNNLNAQAPVLLKAAAGNSINNIKDYSLAIGNTLYFIIRVGGTTDELWKTDGTSAGSTVLVKGGFAGILNMVNINDTLYFVGMASGTSSALWKSDGTLAGTVLVKDFTGSQVSGFTTINNTSYFCRSPFALWKTDGTDLGTLEVKPGLELYATGGIGAFYQAGSQIIFFANSAAAANYKALWKTDGTTAGTSLIRDSIFNTSLQNLIEYSNVGSLGFFTVNSGASNNLWRTDGTLAGTFFVCAGANLRNLTNLNGQLFFCQFASYAYPLWKSDGTIAGTTAVSGMDNVGGSGIASMGNSLYLGGKVGYDSEPYKSDGTAAGTVLLKDINVGTTSSNPHCFTKVNNTMCFVANDGVDGKQIWKTDGIPTGTVMAYAVADTLSSNENLNYMKAFNNYLIFVHAGDLYSLLVSSGTTGINDIVNTNGFVNIYPNPSSGKFQLSIAKATTESIQLKVTDILGKQVYTEMLPAGINNHSIDLSQLPNGIYLLHSDNLNVQKLIIQK